MYIYFIFLFYFLFIPFLFSNPKTSYEEKLQNQIVFSSYAEVDRMKSKLESYKGWEKTILKVLKRLQDHSGKTDIEFSPIILQKDSFNASCFPSAQIIIHTGLLDEIESITRNEKNKPKAMEEYIAAVLAHEISHYYNGHSFNMVKRNLDVSGNVNKAVQNLKFDRDEELEADRSALILLKRASYPIETFVQLLKTLNKKHQTTLKQETQYNPFFNTHPSPNQRLAQIDGKEKDWYQFASKMEVTFANIQSGTELKQSLKDLDEAIIKYPDTRELKEARAICLHKIWENGVEVENLLLRSILHLPSFRNDMLNKGPLAPKAVKVIPGNKMDYYRALKAYKDILNKLDSMSYLLSNYSVLLAYSPGKEKEKEAIEYAELAFSRSKTIPLWNNLAVVYFICQSAEKAQDLLMAIVRQLDSQIFSNAKISKETVQRLQELNKQIRFRQTLNPSYTSDDSTPILNLALIFLYRKDKEKSRAISLKYLQKYESSSRWAEFLKKKNDIQFKAASSSENLSVNGITIGDNLKDLLKKWGNTDNENLEETLFCMDYPDKGAKV
ncbi:MAG: M48 family metallopeptidase, partial [Leptospiraceae bacterium]|nr:M48 family metallopeptidase [Leptospiraceae bacterium]